MTSSDKYRASKLGSLLEVRMMLHERGLTMFDCPVRLIDQQITETKNISVVWPDYNFAPTYRTKQVKLINDPLTPSLIRIMK